MNERNEMRDMFVQTAHRMMRDLCTKELLEASLNGEWPEKLWSMLEEAGMTLLPVPEEAGGVGGGFADAMAIVREAGRFAAPVPLAETVLANMLLSAAGLPVSEGAATVAPVRAADRIVAKKTESGWILSGTAKHVPWARRCNTIVVLAESDNGPVVAAVDAKQCNVNFGEDMAGEPRDEVQFNDILIGVENVSAGHGHINQENVLLLGTLLRSAQMAGALEQLSDLSVQYSTERSQFGRPIARFQAIQQQLALLAGEAIAASTAVESAMAIVDRAEQSGYFSGKPGDEEAVRAGKALHLAAMMAKIRTGEAVGPATAIAHQVHGAIGFTDEHILHYSTRRLWSWREEFGTESEWADLLGRAVLERGGDQLWPLVTSL